MSILQFLNLIDGIPVLNGQLLFLVSSAAIQGMNQEVPYSAIIQQGKILAKFGDLTAIRQYFTYQCFPYP